MPRILLIDDDCDLVETLADWFQSEGHAVETALSGAEALAKLAESRFDAILLDWQLPERPGLEVCREYRAKGGADWILLMTGNREPKHKQIGMAAGANDVLVKPFTLDQLMDRLKSII